MLRCSGHVSAIDLVTQLRQVLLRLHCFTTPLDFTGKLNRTSDVSSIQVELRVEVLLSCDGCGVVRTGALGHIALTETQRQRYK